MTGWSTTHLAPSILFDFLFAVDIELLERIDSNDNLTNVRVVVSPLESLLQVLEERDLGNMIEKDEIGNALRVGSVIKTTFPSCKLSLHGHPSQRERGSHSRVGAARTPTWATLPRTAQLSRSSTFEH